MTGYLCLEGGQELWGAMREPDLRCIKLAGGWRASVTVIATAGVPDYGHKRAGRNAIKWFMRLGALNVRVVPIVDRDSAESAKNAKTLRKSKLIYLLGGSPHYLGQTLRDSASAAAMHSAWHDGAVISGSSAGAMVLCEQYYNPTDRQLYPGLNYLPNSIVLPHHNTFGQNWVDHLRGLAPTATLLGLDEHTAMINDGSKHWEVSGAAGVHLYTPEQQQSFMGGDSFQQAIANS